MLAIRE